MRISSSGLFYFLLATLMLALTFYFSSQSSLGYTILCSLICFSLLVGVVKLSLSSINNITFFFFLFYVLYTYAPIFTVYLDIDTRKLFEGTSAGSSCSFLFLSTSGLFGLTLPFLIKLPKLKAVKEQLISKKDKFTKYALFFLIIATLGEIVNMIRAGGPSLISQGKVIYQAKVGALFITVPTMFLLQIALFFFGLRLYLTYEKKLFAAVRSKIFVVVLFLLAPILLLYFSIGFRSPLLAMAFAFIVGFTYFIGIKKANRRIIALFFIGYSAMAILFGIRGQLKLLFTTGDWSRFEKYVFEDKAYLRYYNPANNEFGASYMNYIKYYNAKEKTTRLFGKSYFEGFIIAIPSALLPFEKPTPIGYKFRDLYFKEYKRRSRIAGTGFSSIMEAHWNFGFLGPIVIYSLLGCFFWLLEYYRNKNRFLFVFPVFYAIMIPLAQSIHRSSSGFYVSYIILILVLLFIIVLVKTLLKELLNTNKKNRQDVRIPK